MSTPTHQPIRIALCVYFTDAGETTRAIEIARGIHDEVEKRGGRALGTAGEGARPNDGGAGALDLRFFFYRCAEGSSNYEQLVRVAGFAVEYFAQEMDDEMWLALLDAQQTGLGMFPPPYEALAAPYVRSVIETLRVFRPTIVVRGLFPEVSVATKILKIPSISFGPIPAEAGWLRTNLVDDVPAAAFDTGNVAMDANRGDGQGGPDSRPANRWTTLHRAAIDCGWPKDSDAAAMPDMMRADECLVCDLESNYQNQTLGAHTHVIGPIFARPTSNFDLSEAMKAVLCADGRKRVFFAMANSGEKTLVKEAVKALCDGTFNAVVAVPPNICSMAELRKYVGTVPEGVVLTDEFVPSNKIAALVDVVLGHGGQGTVQSALSAGVPIVGLVMQWEQRFNLRNAERRGAGVALERDQWTAENIRETVARVIETPSYKIAACQARDEMSQIDGRKNAAERILAFAAAHMHY